METNHGLKHNVNFNVYTHEKMMKLEDMDKEIRYELKETAKCDWERTMKSQY